MVFKLATQPPGTLPISREAKVLGDCEILVSSGRITPLKRALLHQLKSDGIVMRALLEDVWRKMGR